jgi:hypothetical protein
MAFIKISTLVGLVSSVYRRPAAIITSRSDTSPVRMDVFSTFEKIGLDGIGTH